MKKNLRRAAAYALVLSLASLPLLALAADGVVKFENPITAKSIEELLTMLLKFFVRVATVLCVIYMIWSGFLFVKAQGKPEEIDRAKRAFFFALVGTLLMLGAEVIATAIGKTITDISK